VIGWERIGRRRWEKMETMVESFQQEGGLALSMLSLFLSNYREACEKQRRPQLAKLFALLARSFEIQAKRGMERVDTDQLLEDFQNSLADDLQKRYPAGESLAEEQGNRGVLRMTTWGKKVTTIQNALIKRFQKSEGVLLKEGQRMYVCAACGFIGVGTEPPAVCPVCKAPASRFITST
jgi:rubrerythrin